MRKNEHLCPPARMKPQTKKFAWSFTLMLVVLIGWCWLTTLRTRRKAERFFQDAQRLEIGHATADQVLGLVYSAHQRTNGGFAACLSGAGECTGTVFFDNVWLYRLHLAPIMVFAYRFDIEDYKLQERWIEMIYSNDGLGERGTFVHEGNSTAWPDETLRKPEEKYFRISGGRPSGYLGVLITPQTPLNLRRIAYNFNFSCLSKIGGCKVYEEMLPALAQGDLYWGQDPWMHEFRPGDVVEH